jgi:Holliday junction DNA helicase RuvA
VGKRTAERLSVELRSKLQERFGAGFAAGLPADDDLNGGSDAGATALAAPELREELQLTLTALGYEPLEINRALRAVAAQEPALAPDGEAWLRESLRWLSRTAA